MIAHPFIRSPLHPFSRLLFYYCSGMLQSVPAVSFPLWNTGVFVRNLHLTNEQQCQVCGVAPNLKNLPKKFRWTRPNSLFHSTSRLLRFSQCDQQKYLSWTKPAMLGPAELDHLQNLGVERLNRPGWSPHLFVARLVSSLRRRMSCQVGCRGCVWSFFFLDLLKE